MIDHPNPNETGSATWADALQFECPSRTLQDHASNHTEQDGAAEAGGSGLVHSRATIIDIGDNHG